MYHVLMLAIERVCSGKRWCKLRIDLGTALILCIGACQRLRWNRKRALRQTRTCSICLSVDDNCSGVIKLSKSFN